MWCLACVGGVGPRVGGSEWESAERGRPVRVRLTGPARAMTVRRSPLVAGSGDSDMAAFAMPYTVFLILGSEDCCATALAPLRDRIP